MKQIVQNLSSREIQLVDVPVPSFCSGEILIESSMSLISKGTEQMLVDFGKSNWIRRVKQQPDKVIEVLDKIKTDGFFQAYDAVKSRLEQPLILGYSNVGKVLESDDPSFNKGDRVVSNGPHAEIISSPINLCAKVPDNVDDESAAFTIVGSIALQGVRLANPTIGETFIVYGLGLIGLITTQILQANGCKVIGIDLDQEKCNLAKSYGAEAINLSDKADFVQNINDLTKGIGADGSIITTNTSDNSPVSLSAKACRKKGRIILIGMSGLELNRQDFYEKEISFQVSCSYGPGRYDESFERDGIDYPVGFVRWTENRNFQAFLDLISSGAINLKPLISNTFDITSSLEAYKAIDDSSSLGVIIDYDSSNLVAQKRTIDLGETLEYEKDKVILGVLGAGNYGSRVLIPAFKKAGALNSTLVTSKGISATFSGKKNNFSKASTSIDEILNDEKINTVAVVTRHNQHADQVIKLLNADKNIFVEKPLAINLEDLNSIEEIYLTKKNLKLMVGFNRRFAPLVRKLKKLIENTKSPKSFIYTINAGHVPKNHWTQDMEIGGGRLIGEACHMIDLMRFLAGDKIIDFKIQNSQLPSAPNNQDNFIITMKFANNSICSINYFSTGGKKFPKERIEVFYDNSALRLDNFRSLKGFNIRGFKFAKSFFQDKGNQNCVNAFVQSIQEGKRSPISFEEIMEVSRISIEISKNMINRN